MSELFLKTGLRFIVTKQGLCIEIDGRKGSESESVTRKDAKHLADWLIENFEIKESASETRRIRDAVCVGVAQNETEYQELLNSAIEKWGEKTQVVMAMGEMGELTAALNRHYNQGRFCSQEIIGEIADVQIMLDQLRWIFGGFAVESAKTEKVARLHRLLQKAEPVKSPPDAEVQERHIAANSLNVTYIKPGLPDLLEQLGELDAGDLWLFAAVRLTMEVALASSEGLPDVLEHSEADVDFLLQVDQIREQLPRTQSFRHGSITASLLGDLACMLQIYARSLQDALEAKGGVS
jgi:hypothetical protein